MIPILLPIIDKEKFDNSDVKYTQEMTLTQIRYAEFDFLREKKECNCKSNSIFELKKIMYCYHNAGIDYHNYIEFPFEDVEIIRHDFSKIPFKKYFLFFDTETTGLPKNIDASYKDLNNWPRLVQIAWILADENGEIKNQKDYIIKPEGFSIPKESTKVHGISNEDATLNGTLISKILSEFAYFLECTDYIVAHNIKFDFNIVASELIRNNISSSLIQKQQICTMKSTVNYCKIPGDKGYKYPKLVDLYKTIFHSEFNKAHDSFVDVGVLFKCFYELKRMKIIII